MVKIKLMGGKSRIAKDIVLIIQKCINDNDLKVYIEPFVGGLNVIDKVRCKYRYGTDKNKYLIALFKHLQDNGELLPEVPRELYSEVRANYKNGEYEDWYVGNIGFLASYNGRWFDGGYAQSGYEKTKTGQRYRDYYKEAKNNIESQIPYIKDIILENKDYKDITPNKNTMIYCDPPYANVKQFANALDFDYNAFWGKIREWSKDCFVLISELSAPEDFKCIWEKPFTRTLDRNKENQFKVVEKLFTYKP